MHTPETRARIRAAMIGRPCTAATRAKMSAAALARTDRHHSAATRAKISAGQIGKRRSRAPYDPDDVSTWTDAERRQFKLGRTCEWPGGCSRGWLCLDHDHRTGRPRGVLCDFHNQRVLGFHERYAGQAEEYLARFR